MLGQLINTIKSALITNPNEADYRADFETQITNKSFLSRAATGEYLHKETEIEWQNFKRNEKIIDEAI